MSEFKGYMHGIGIGGWLTNFKRLRFIPLEMSTVVTTGDREHFESYITEKDVQQIASWGCDHIRLAFDYVFFEEDAAPMKLREDDLGFKYLDRFIAWCKKYDLNVLLDLHRAAGSSCEYTEDSSLMDDPALQERFLWLWRETAKHYRAEGANLAFELLNEVHAPTPAKWNALAKRAVAAIRELNPERKVVIGSNNYGSPSEFKTLDALDDANVVYSFHSYNPFEFTHQRAVISPITATYNRYMKYPSEIEPYLDFRKFAKLGCEEYQQVGRIDRIFLERGFQAVFDFQAKHAAPVYCGEFGVIRHCDIKSRENYYRDVIALCDEHHIGHAAWNYLSAPYDANRFSIVDDWDRKPLSEELIRIIK